MSKKLDLETEENMKNNQIDAIISTSSLEMGIDWDTISQIINIGTPKGINRLVQRIVGQIISTTVYLKLS